MSTEPAGGAESPRDYLVPELRGAVTVRWIVVALGIYNVVVASAGGGWARAAGWAVVTASLLALNVLPRRVGTRVEHDGFRRGRLWWGPSVPWGDVAAVHVAGPYDSGSRAEVRGRRDVQLLGMSPDDVRALAREHDLPVRDAARPQAARGGGGADGDDLDGPFRRGR